jgi:GNAT superfamily N-acetyltransferase
MRSTLSTPSPDRLGALVEELASWQQEGLPVQLHSGDLGWHWRFGTAALAEALRVWTVDDTTVAIGFVDDDAVIRMAVAPVADHDEELAEELVRDLEDPARAVRGAARVTVEARFGTAFRSRLRRRGWAEVDPWTPLVRDLADPVEAVDLRVEVVGPDHVEDRVAVQLASFDRSTFTVEKWHAMAQAPAYARARCLVGYDAHAHPVAAVTVWSAGPGRPGLLEPMGVHRDHRGHGHGTAICLAAARALRDLGASSATVATPGSNTAGVATYARAGYRRLPDVPDFVNTRQ